MAIHSRYMRTLALVGVLALGSASAAWAQQPTNAPAKDTSAMRPDTSGYKGYQNDSSVSKAGAATDTMLKGDLVVCKDGSNAPTGQGACGAHGDVDSVATAAAKKARGSTSKDTTTAK